MTQFRNGAFVLLFLLASSQIALPAHAASDEIQVYTQEMDEPGELGLELHLNFVPKGRRESSYPGEMKSENRLQVTPEFSYGLTKTLEAGLYLPVAISGDGNAYGNGLRFRLKYIAPRDEEHGFFWGLNTELGYFSRRVSQSAIGMEFRPIIGYVDDKWLISFNPIVNMDLSDNFSKQPNFEPAVKLTHRVVEGVRAGVEYYGDYGRLTHPLPTAERTHYLYGVVDVDLKGFDLNLGLGRGIKNAEDQWILKAILAIPLN